MHVYHKEYLISYTYSIFKITYLFTYIMMAFECKIGEYLSFKIN